MDPQVLNICFDDEMMMMMIDDDKMKRFLIFCGTWDKYLFANISFSQP